MAKPNQTTAPVSTEAPSAQAQGITLNESQQAAFDGMKTKSERIRYLASLGHKTSSIGKYLTTVYGKLVRYQHVRNVLKTPLKKS